MTLEANSHDLLVEKIADAISKALQTPEWTLTHSDEKVNYDEKLTLGKYELKFKTPNPSDPMKGKIASFELYPMINCCAICVSTTAWVHPFYQHRGIGRTLNSLRIDIARYLGYGLLLCTDVESNEYQRKILKTNGWKDIHKLVNPRTMNTVFISVINL